MLTKLIRQKLWYPFEQFCRQYPLIPLNLEITEFHNSVIRIRVSNIITKAISKIGGNYDYSVCYLIDNSLLVDTGFPWARRSLKRYLIESGADQTIQTVINTHSHEDHTGNNDLVIEIAGAGILAHPLAIKTIKYPSELPWYRNFMFGPQVAVMASKAPNYFQTDNCQFEVIHTPGHSEDHICVFEKNKRWLFSGDLYVAAELDSQLSDVDGNKWIKSLELIIKLKPTCLFDGHGIVVQGETNVEKLLIEKLAFLLNLKQRILAEAQSPISIREITNRVFSKKTFVNQITFSEGWLSLLTSSDFTRVNIVKSFLNDDD